MSVYKKLLDMAEKGGYWNVDLKKKSLKINNKYYVKDGELKVDDELISKEEIGDNPWDTISNLFRNYQRSRPSRKEKRKSFFKALDMQELNTSDLAYNEPRALAQAKLEGYILLAGLNKAIEWQNERHWFWQDPVNSDCIVLKEWI